MSHTTTFTCSCFPVTIFDILLFIGLFKTKVHELPLKDEFIDSKKKINNIVIQVLVPWIVLVIGFFVKSIIS